jgi:LruC domain-containing protein
MRPILNYSISFIVCLLFQSCLLESEIEKSIGHGDFRNLKVPFGFNFATTQDIPVSLEVFLLGGQPYEGAIFDVFLDKPEELSDEKDLSAYRKIATVTLDKRGKYEGKFKIPIDSQKLYLFSKSGGIQSLIELDKGPLGFQLYYKPTVKTPSGRQNFFPSFELSKINSNPTTLGTWNNVGYPNYLSANNFVSSALLRRTRDILSPGTEIDPNKKGTPNANNEYSSIVKLDLLENQTASVDLTFLFSLAANANTLGYYWYPTDNPPATRNDITNRRIVFPNTKTTGSPNSGMLAGETVRLIGPNSNGSFPPNTTIGFFLVQNSFTAGTGNNAGTINFTRTTFYSESKYNLSPGNEQRFVSLYDAPTNQIIFGVEDGGISGNGWSGRDNDFDDVVFFVSYTPDDAVDLTGTPTTNQDPSPAGDDLLYIPSSTTFGTIMFDDSWPILGDGDFNDIVIDYRYSALASATEVSGNNRYISKINVRAKLAMVDAANSNGLGILIPGINPANVSQITNLDITGKTNYNTNQSKTYSIESGHTGDVVVLLFDDANQLFEGPCFNSGNVGCSTGSPIEFSFTITLNPMARQSNFNAISPFVILSKKREKELHAPGNRPSIKANKSLFGTADDSSNEGQSRYFLSSQNLLWGLNVNQAIPVPKNGISISDSYPEFSLWATSGGTTHTSWFSDSPGKRVASKLINRQN